MMDRDPIDVIAELFAGEGRLDYLGEPVSVAVHMLQAAALAEEAGAPNHLVAAALLHDVGHFRGLPSGRDPSHGTDHRHEDTGATWLSRWFPDDVTEPIRLHVAAKRYLCSAEPGYMSRLSAASTYTLAVQGGPMSDGEALHFLLQLHAAGAIAVRRWDEAAKDPAVPAVSFEHFRPLLRSLERRPGWG